MLIELYELPDGRLRHTATGHLPMSGTVPVDLHALDDAGWAAQSAVWFKDDPEDLKALRDAAISAISGEQLEPHPEYVAKEIPYTILRRRAYGSYGDQLDMMYKDMVDGTTTWKDHIAAVKQAIPKE